MRRLAWTAVGCLVVAGVLAAGCGDSGSGSASADAVATDVVDGDAGGEDTPASSDVVADDLDLDTSVAGADTTSAESGDAPDGVDDDATTEPGLGRGLLDCIGILACLSLCAEGDLICQKSCQAQAYPGPAEHAVDLRVCFAVTCAGQGLPCWTEQCWEAYSGCFGLGRALTCSEMWGCVGSCTVSEQPCQPACIADAEDAATAAVFAELLTCLETECPGGTISDSDTTCQTAATCGDGPCSGAWSACLEPVDCP